MSKKDTGLNDALSFIMGKSAEAKTPKTWPQHGHDMDIIGPQESHDTPMKGPQKAPARPKKEKLVNHHIGLYPSDWEALERIAEAEGGNVAILIRRAIREMLARNSDRE